MTQVYAVEGEREYIVNVKGKNSVILVPGLLTWWDDNWTELYTIKKLPFWKIFHENVSLFDFKKVLMISICYESEKSGSGTGSSEAGETPSFGPAAISWITKSSPSFIFNKLFIYICMYDYI